MRIPILILPGLVAVALPLFGPAIHARELSFEERVRAEAAVERVHFAHQTDVKVPFDQAFPREAIERKVRKIMAESAALEEMWKTPITAEMLKRETERMAKQTRMPARLAELFSALHGDPFLVQECLARPVLVDRLARSFFAFDRTLHAETRREADQLHTDLLSSAVDATKVDARRVTQELARAHEGESPQRLDPARPERAFVSAEELEARRREARAWPSGISSVVEQRDGFVVQAVLDDDPDLLRIATYRIPKSSWDEWWESHAARWSASPIKSVAPSGAVLPEIDANTSRDLASCIPYESWEDISDDAPPDPRFEGATAVWTGTVMIVWGGRSTTYRFYDTGKRYDPATDSWTAVSRVNAPSERLGHSAVWTGTEMIVWGGWTPAGPYRNDGARYDPLADAWTPISTANAPSPRFQHTAVWLQGRMIVWGGGNPFTGTGGSYDPIMDTWTTISSTGAPSARSTHTAVATASEMIIWGGVGSSPTYLNSGARYDPIHDSWAPTQLAGAPEARAQHSAVWSGSRMIVWGGHSSGPNPTSGGRYDPATDQWSATTTVGAPPGRSSPIAVWTGTRMLVWGGGGNLSGGRYDPLADSWSPITVTGAPQAWGWGVWDGNRMIVWGGGAGTVPGGRYDPASDTWTPTSMGTEPSPRIPSAMAWTGSKLVIWGGSGSGAPNSGGVYDPATGNWTATSLLNAPAYGVGLGAGDRVIVWGWASGVPVGGIYDPLQDTWSPMSVSGAPSARFSYSRVWTGSQMILWGGNVSTSDLSTGGRYDPATNSWSATSTVGAPGARENHTAVWTGNQMIVWGGAACSGSGPTYFCLSLDTGGRYDPVSNSWTAMAPGGSAASPRELHAAAWGGGRMYVWGGEHWGSGNLNTGGSYDPALNQWTALPSAPLSTRTLPTAVWTSGRLVVWGGAFGTDTGAVYDPNSNSWTPTVLPNRPAIRAFHAAVAVEEEMWIWGGSPSYLSYLNNGRRYVFRNTTDNDGDGYSGCEGDCDDLVATIHPGVVELCNGRDDDCNGSIDEDVAPPTQAPTLRVERDTQGRSMVAWDSVPEASGYDVVRGRLEQLRASGGDFTSATDACVGYEITSSPVLDDAPTNPGGGAWWLIRASNCGGHGSYDGAGPGQAASRDPSIAASANACP